MLILPIVNKNKILNVKFSLREAKKIKTGVDTLESDVIVNGRSFLNSSWKNEKDSKTLVDFIRNNLVSKIKKYTITTKVALNSKLCDVYEVVVPPTKVSDAFDNIYSSTILDMLKETPGNIKGKYLSFKKCGFDEVFSDDKIAKVRRIVLNDIDQNNWIHSFEKEGLTETIQVLDLIDIFDCTIISEATIPEDTMLQVLASFSKINSKDTKSLNNYYNLALSNGEIYAKMLYVSKMVNGKNLNLIRKPLETENRQLVKTNEREMDNVA